MARFFVQDLGLALAPKRAPNEQSFKTAKIIVRRFCRETLLFFFQFFFWTSRTLRHASIGFAQIFQDLTACGQYYSPKIDHILKLSKATTQISHVFRAEAKMFTPFCRCKRPWKLAHVFDMPIPRPGFLPSLPFLFFFFSFCRLSWQNFSNNLDRPKIMHKEEKKKNEPPVVSGLRKGP